MRGEIGNETYQAAPNRNPVGERTGIFKIAGFAGKQTVHRAPFFRGIFGTRALRSNSPAILV